MKCDFLAFEEITENKIKQYLKEIGFLFDNDDLKLSDLTLEVDFINIPEILQTIYDINQHLSISDINNHGISFYEVILGPESKIELEENSFIEGRIFCPMNNIKAIHNIIDLHVKKEDPPYFPLA